MQTIYCISGLGADEGAFQYLDLSFTKPVFIKWIKPLKNETLESYALRLKAQYIKEEAPFILGLSLGGMIAIEIAKAFPSAKTIIISSAKTKFEIPFYWKLFRLIPVYKILPEWLVRNKTPLRNFFLGAKQQKTKNYIAQVAAHANVSFYRWAIGAILTWRNKTIPPNITHIHGTKDKLLAYKFVKPDISINGAGHLMIIENAEEISKRIKTLFV